MGPRKHRLPASAWRPLPRSGQPALWLYGRHPVLAAVRNPRRQLERLLATGETAAELEAGVATAPISRPMVEVVHRRLIASLVPADAVHQGFATLARPLPAYDLQTVIDRSRTTRAIVAVLDHVTDPRNVGAVLRSVEAFAAAAVVVQDRHAPEESGALAKAAAGALEGVPLIRVTNLARSLRTLRERNFRCIGFAGDAPMELARAPLQDGHLALVLGSEGAGLRRLVRGTCDAIVRIPIAPAVDSLNVSAAAAIALYECRRDASIYGLVVDGRRSSDGRATAL